MKSKIPYYFIALIGTFMLLDFAFVTLAKLTYTGVYTDNHYKKGMDFNKIYGSEVYSDKTGWRSQAKLSTKILGDETKLKVSLERPQDLIFQLLDKNGRPISEANVMGKLLRPVTDKYDSVLEFKEISKGLYKSNLSIPMNGQWHIRIKAGIEGKEFVSTYKIIVNP